ncbi:signal transduction histidine kinase [Natronoflexus pectinivorans]|uniref:histidine kinase n=2 Tax=Natronoflexus pectinivorans TaxID=682526 RepID=A0A4R2GK20_9BACT|nr:signal transduction histidine kinase [Natronoflexus pectinivorans]
MRPCMSFYMYRYLLLAIFVANAMVLSAQTPVTFERYSTFQGLPQNSVFSIAQDASGFIWLATYDGISRFDGFQFVSYKPEPGNIGGLSSNITVALEADDEGKLWIGTTGSGLSMFDTRTLMFRNYPSDDTEEGALSDNNVNAILPLSNNVLVGTNHGLNKLNRESGHFSVFLTGDGLAGNNILALNKWCHDKTWVATNNGLQLISLGDEIVQHAYLPQSQTGGQVLSLKTDHNQRLWTVSSSQLSCFREEDGEFILEMQLTDAELNEQFSSTGGFSVIVMGKNDEIWLGTHGGLFRLKESAQKLFAESHFINALYDEHSLPGNQIISLMTDEEGILWIGTRFNGLAKYDPYKQPVTRFVHNPANPNSIHSNDVRAISQDVDGNIWMGSRNQGVDFINVQTGEIERFEANSGVNGALYNNSIRDLYLDTRDRLWVGYYSGFSQIERDGLTGNVLFHPAKDSVGNRIHFGGHTYFFYEDSKSRFWVATSDGLIQYDPRNNRVEWYRNEFTQSPNLGNFFRSVCEDADGYLWLATDGIGVFRLNPETREFTNFRHFLDDPATLSHNKVYVIAKDLNQDLWFGTHSGLNRLCKETGNFYHFTQEDGLSNNIVYGIMPDQNGFLWLTTANGLSRFNPQNNTFKTYLSGIEFSDDAFSISRDGKIFVGGLSGFFAFHPDSLRENQFAAPLRFTGFRLHNDLIQPGETYNGRIILPEALSFLEEITLKHNENFFSVEFAMLSYASPTQNRYQFLLEGLHTQWFDASSGERIAVFTGLKPGRYILRVRGANPDGIWSESSLTINILPAFYQTTWFRGLLMLIFAAIIVLFYRLRLRSLTRQKITLENQVVEKTRELQNQNDILKNQHDEIVRQRDQVVEMTRMVHDADERKLRFFTGVSHEIRTPLTLILGPVEQMLNNSDVPQSVRDRLDRVYRNARNLHKLINQLLDFRKIDSGLMPVELSAGDINSFLHNQVELCHNLIAEKKLQIEFKLNEHIPTSYFDIDIVEKIIQNLLTNAIKYSPTGGKITLETEIVFTNEDKVIGIRVADHGAGIPAEEQSRIFDRFYRASHSRQNINDGLGIGLSFSRDLARLHGGDILLEQSTGNGSTFLFRFPLNVSHTAKNKGVETREILPSGLLENQKSDEDPGKTTVLIIEDNDDLRAFIKDGFEGFKILEASDGNRGLQLAVEHIPDIIVSDILMPGLNGFEVCRRLKEEVSTAHIPVLLLTALGAAEHQKAGVDCGADDYIVKPFNVQLLAGKVRNILSARKHYRERLLSHYQIPASDKESKGDPLLDSVTELVLSNLTETGFGVEEISRKLNMSRSTFYRKISSLTGVSPVEFIRRIRLRESCILLKSESGITINEVAFRVGFEDVDYFRNCFKKVYGKTPSEY